MSVGHDKGTKATRRSGRHLARVQPRRGEHVTGRHQRALLHLTGSIVPSQHGQRHGQGSIRYRKFNRTHLGEAVEVRAEGRQTHQDQVVPVGVVRVPARKSEISVRPHQDRKLQEDNTRIRLTCALRRCCAFLCGGWVVARPHQQGTSEASWDPCRPRPDT